MPSYTKKFPNIGRVGIAKTSRFAPVRGKPGLDFRTETFFVLTKELSQLIRNAL